MQIKPSLCLNLFLEQRHVTREAGTTLHSTDRAPTAPKQQQFQQRFRALFHATGCHNHDWSDHSGTNKRNQFEIEHEAGAQAKLRKNREKPLLQSKVLFSNNF